MTKIRSSPKKKQKQEDLGVVHIKTTIKGPKDSTTLELNKGDVAFVVGENDSTLYLPVPLGDDDSIPEHMQLLVAMATLFKNDPTFRKYLKKRWSTILKELDEEDPEFQKKVKLAKPKKKTTIRRRPT